MGRRGGLTYLPSPLFSSPRLPPRCPYFSCSLQRGEPSMPRRGEVFSPFSVDFFIVAGFGPSTVVRSAFGLDFSCLTRAAIAADVFFFGCSPVSRCRPARGFARQISRLRVRRGLDSRLPAYTSWGRHKNFYVIEIFVVVG